MTNKTPTTNPSANKTGTDLPTAKEARNASERARWKELDDSGVIRRGSALLLGVRDQLDEARSLARIFTMIDSIDTREDNNAMNLLAYRVGDQLAYVSERLELITELLSTPEQRAFIQNRVPVLGEIDCTS